MGTRSTVKFYDEFQNQILSVYQQFDGYIEGVGYKLANWLKKKKVINGFSDEKMSEGYANGMGCLAAQYIAEHKDKIGSLYVATADEEEGYNYKVKFIDEKLIIEVNDYFVGTPDELLNHKWQDDDDDDENK